MSDPDRLADLLRSVDADAGPPPALPADLARRVRLRAARRSRRRVVFRSTAAGVLLAVGLSSAWYVWAPRGAPPGDVPVAGSPSVHELKRQIAHLDAEASWRVAVAERVAELQDQRRPSPAPSLGPPRRDPVVEARMQRDATAFVLVDSADHLQRELGRTSAAIETYQEVIRLLPETAAAAVARQKLAEIEDKGGPSS